MAVSPAVTLPLPARLVRARETLGSFGAGSRPRIMPARAIDTVWSNRYSILNLFPTYFGEMLFTAIATSCSAIAPVCTVSILAAITAESRWFNKFFNYLGLGIGWKKMYSIRGNAFPQPNDIGLVFSVARTAFAPKNIVMVIYPVERDAYRIVFNDDLGEYFFIIWGF